MSANTIDLRDVRVSITFAEEEARFLAGVVSASLPYLTSAQAELAERIAAKFILAGEGMKDELIAQHGLDAVRDMAERAMAAYPDVEDVRIQ